MKLFNLVENTLQEITAIELPVFESKQQAINYLDDAQTVYIKYKQYLELLHKADRVSESIQCGTGSYDLMTEHECPVLELCAMDTIGYTLNHVSAQTKRLKALCDDVEAWINDETECVSDYDEHNILNKTQLGVE